MDVKTEGMVESALYLLEAAHCRSDRKDWDVCIGCETPSERDEERRVHGLIWKVVSLLGQRHEARLAQPPLYVELSYPRVKGQPNEILVSLIDVRAAGDILIRYDFDRDGWSILRDSFPEKPWEDHVEDWQEAAFVKAPMGSL